MQAPESMGILLSRLFGSKSVELKNTDKSPTQWRSTLRKSLDELFIYARDNVDTDQVHWLTLCSGFYACHEALKKEEFWLGYIEGLTRICLLLMGDYPDNRKYKCGKKGKAHYRLNLNRTLQYTQDSEQKKHTLLAASNNKFPNLGIDIGASINECRSEMGADATPKQYLEWFKQKYPNEYASIF